MLRAVAIICGILFLCFGMLGFISQITPNNVLFSLFSVNPLVNSLHLLTGGLAIWRGSISRNAAKLFFQFAGFVYALITILGFGCKETRLFGILANNMADTWANLLFSIFFLYFGFCVQGKQAKNS